MTIQESDILFYGGGAALQQFGTFTRRTMVPRRGGEEDVETHTRTGAVGVLRSRDGFLHTAEANTPRYHWDGTRYTLLLERAGTNAWSRSEEFDDAAWTKTNCTISADAIGAPDTTTTADKIVEASDTNQSHRVERNLAGSPTNDTDQAVSVFAASAERTWLRITTVDKAGTAASSWVNLSTGAAGTTSGSHTLSIDTETYNFGAVTGYRIAVVYDVGSGGTTPLARFAVATADAVSTYNGDGASGIYVWGGQNEADVSESTSYMGDTGASTLTRAADLFTVPFYHAPQSMQWYCRFIEGDATNNARVMQIGAAGDTDARFNLRRITSTDYRATHDPGSGVAADVTLTPAIGDLVELLVTMAATGTVQIDARKNGGATVSGSTSSAATFASSWSGPLLTINSVGATNAAVRRYHALIGTRGTGQTFADFTALLP